MRVFVVKGFGRFQRREKITDAMLCGAVNAATTGLVDAKLGAELIKQRIARPGQGKRGGFRALVALRGSERAVFLYGFAKSERENIAPDRLAELKLYASRWLGFDDDAIERAIADDELREVFCDEEGKET
jgi:hypothetical protein